MKAEKGTYKLPNYGTICTFRFRTRGKFWVLDFCYSDCTVCNGAKCLKSWLELCPWLRG